MTSAREKVVVGVGFVGLGTLGCGPSGFESLEGFGSLGDDAGSDEALEEDSETGDPYEGAFELLEAEIEDAYTIVLTFSHPLGPIDAVDPSDFRISFALSNRYQNYYGGFYESTQYRDANYFGYSFNAFRVASLVAAPESDARLRLEFDWPLRNDACNYVEIWGNEPIEPPNERIVGLFVHHRAGPIPLQDGQGTPLDDFGASWVDYAGSFMFVGEFGLLALDPRVEIPCN